MTETEIMLRAIELARKAAELDEVPVGAVVVKDGEIVGEGFNRRETGKNALAHAELEAIDNACKRLGGWRLHQCEIYVTLEPCPMCAGAISNARINRLVYGAKEKTSNDNLCEKILSSERLNHKTEIIFDSTYEEEISQTLSNFFKQKRTAK